MGSRMSDDVWSLSGSVHPPQLEQVHRLERGLEETVLVQRSRFTVQGFPFKVYCSRFTVQGSPFKVYCSRLIEGGLGKIVEKIPIRLSSLQLPLVGWKNTTGLNPSDIF